MFLKNFFDSYVSLTDTELSVIQKYFQKKSFSKGEKLLENGNVCNHLFLIEKGLGRSYFINEKGKDISVWFFSEGKAITSVESFFNRLPSKYDIEALEETIAFVISYNDLQKLFDRFHSFERFGRLLSIHMLSDMAQRLNAIQFQSAKERYAYLNQKHPDIAFRAPLQHIASYLGITQETLSRVRAK